MITAKSICALTNPIDNQLKKFDKLITRLRQNDIIVVNKKSSLNATVVENLSKYFHLKMWTDTGVEQGSKFYSDEERNAVVFDLTYLKSNFSLTKV